MEENGAEKDTTTEVVTDPANDPATLESALLVSTYAALSKLADYVPTEYVNNSEPDIDAEHLNNTEQGLLRVTNLLNGAVDVINDLQTTVAKQASAIDTLNSNKAEIYRHKHVVNAVANQAVEIPGTEGYQTVIPVIFENSSTLSYNATIMQDSGKWWLFSTVSQELTILFWELKKFIG